MSKMPEMKYNVGIDAIQVILPLISKGKFRCKNRSDIQKFGEGFAPKTTPIKEESYLEWQIGYDTIIGKDEKNTKLKATDFIFIGANGKSKYPYELSEILYYMCDCGVVSKDEIKQLYKKIDDMNEYLQDKYPIDVKKEDPVTFNKIQFLASSTKLPTFITEVPDCKLKIEIMIQKQQYATGTQPMLYLIVPMNAFDNSERIIGYTSSQTPSGVLSFDRTMKNLIFNLFICFGMCSKSHNHDIKEILKIINKNAFN